MFTDLPAITPMDLRSAGDREYERLHEFLNIVRKEQLPEDPPLTLEERLAHFRNLPAFIEISSRLAWDAAQEHVIGYCEGSVWNTGDNEHITLMTIYVHPAYRCRGIGRRLLAHVVDFARAKGRRLLLTMTYGSIPAGEAFLLRLGARRGLETRTNRLRLSDLPAGWVEGCLRAGEALAERFELGVWDGPLPEESLAPMVALIEELHNDSPRDQMEVEDESLTPEMFRQQEQNLFARGFARRMIYLRERAGGQFVGMTEVSWHPDRPAIVIQGLTAVMPAFRNQGLGRWLKAAMVDLLLREHPETEVIRTGNANSNAPMLKINAEMGFQPYLSHTVWQVEREKVEEYLAGR